MSELAMPKCAPEVRTDHAKVCFCGQNWLCPSVLLRSEQAMPKCAPEVRTVHAQLVMSKCAPEVRTGHVQVCS
ncbi:hypothetical protein DPMN_168220 [Dreissena polymorpha]|uniref:Uncharacterized protein n=1 Tax=Dreissena polymorpha TaxID=45954 RepID=A0A9D4IX12_DREPO|nr:hypothetical protein DPMN_168220 [Dreissena polymorpha]